MALCMVIFSVLQNVSQDAGQYLLYVKVGLGVFLWMLLILFYQIDLKYLLFIFAVFFWGLLCTWGGSALTIKENVVIIATYVPTALYFVLEKHFHIRLWEALYVVLCGFLLIMYFLNDIPELVFYETSRNYISVYLVLLLLLLTIQAEKLNQKVPLWWGLLFFAASIVAIGRAGIIVSGIYLLGQLMIRYIQTKSCTRREWIKVLLLSLGVVLIVAFVIYYDMIMNRFFSRFLDSASSGSDSQRMKIYSTYLKTWTGADGWKHFLFGKNPQQLSSLLKSLKGNLHSSYLMLHARFGIMGVTGLFAGLAFSLALCRKERRWSLMLILCMVALRAITDYAFPYFLGDIFCWYCIFSMQDCFGRKLKRTVVKW